MTTPDQVVFDTEPLVAYADDEPGSDLVGDYLEGVVTGDTDGQLTFVNATEVRYILARKYDRETADTFLDWLWTIGVGSVSVDSVWDDAAEYVIDHDPALGDAYALAAASKLDATLLVGGDQEYDGIADVTIERFRDHGV